MLKTTCLLEDSNEKLWLPEATVLSANAINTDYIFLQNDTATNPSSPWYVTKVDNTQYTMKNAKAPKGGQYIGAFIRDVATDQTKSRVDSTARWATSDPKIIQLTSVTSSGQAIINILRSGTSILTVSWGKMNAVLTLVAK